jgi:hypothetical protein
LASSKEWETDLFGNLDSEALARLCRESVLGRGVASAFGTSSSCWRNDCPKAFQAVPKLLPPALSWVLKAAGTSESLLCHSSPSRDFIDKELVTLISRNHGWDKQKVHLDIFPPCRMPAERIAGCPIVEAAWTGAGLPPSSGTACGYAKEATRTLVRSGLEMSPLCARDIPTVLAHPLHFHSDGRAVPISAWEKLALLFERFEAVNGQRDTWQNMLTVAWLQSLDETKLEKIGKRVGLSPSTFCTSLSQVSNE